MGAHVKLSGSWSNVSDIYARVGGSWKEVTEGYVKLSGAWEPFFSAGVPLTVNYLVIAGGGGGGGGTFGYTAGGGGAGGYRTSAGTSGGGASAESALTLAVATNYTVTVGAGGARGTTTDTAGLATNGSNGANSVFATITSTGGGGGGRGDASTAGTGNSGGSGGGGGTANVSGSSTAGTGTANQGRDGGAGRNRNGDSNNLNGGGGGGASVAGTAGGDNQLGNGGNGVASTITGTSVTYAGGGGGASFADGVATGGSGGGGVGARVNPSASNATAGTVNTGSGGGGGAQPTTSEAGAGGSGVVIIKYPDFYAISVSAGLNHMTTTSGGYRITQFLAGTGTVSFSEAVASDYELIGSVYLSSSQASVTFDLTGLSSTYKHLQIRGTFRSTRSATGEVFAMRFNGDTATNYSWHLLQGNGSTVVSDAGVSADYMRCALGVGSSGTANVFGGAVIDILDAFQTTKHKTIRSLTGQASNTNFVNLQSGSWRNTNALSSITMFPAFGNDLAQYCRFSLYGLKG